MTTGLDLITSAFRKAGILTKSETPASDEAVDALETLNELLSSWSNESILCVSRTEESPYTLTPNDGEYTIGTGANINTARPIRIVSGFTRSGSIDTPLDPITDEAYAAIADKAAQGTPRFINYDNANPTAKIKLWPLPATADALYLVTEKEITELTLAGTVTFAPGWKRAVVHNLAVELAPEYGVEIPASVERIAKESKGSISRAILKARSMDANPTGKALYNILSGWQ